MTIVPFARAISLAVIALTAGCTLNKSGSVSAPYPPGTSILCEFSNGVTVRTVFGGCPEGARIAHVGDQFKPYNPPRQPDLNRVAAPADPGLPKEPIPSPSPPPQVGKSQPSTLAELRLVHRSEHAVSGPVVDIDGQVQGGGEIAELTVDSKPVEVRKNGRFSFRRAVPLGETEISLTALDEWGRTATSKVKVVRTQAVAVDSALPEPNPHVIRGKVRPNALALIIGVERYASVPSALFAERDARVFYDYASGVLGVPENRIRILTGDGARRLDIEKTVATWLVPQIGQQTEVFVFFSGHGLASDDGKDLFLLPYDGDRSFLSGSSIRRQELVASITAAKPKSVRMFLDTCYSGGTRTGETLIASIRPVLLAAKDSAVPQGVTIHTASANDQVSSTLPAARHGLFSYYLMRGLQGEADADGDHRISDAELHDYLGKHVPSSAAMQGRAQMPQMLGSTSDPLVVW